MTEPADGLVDTEHAARALGVPASLIRVWKTRRRITPHSMTPGRGRAGESPLYRLDELRPLAEAYHQRATRRSVDG